MDVGFGLALLDFNWIFRGGRGRPILRVCAGFMWRLSFSPKTQKKTWKRDNGKTMALPHMHWSQIDERDGWGSGPPKPSPSYQFFFFSCALIKGYFFCTCDNNTSYSTPRASYEFWVFESFLHTWDGRVQTKKIATHLSGDLWDVHGLTTTPLAFLGRNKGPLQK